MLDVIKVARPVMFPILDMREHGQNSQDVQSTGLATTNLSPPQLPLPGTTRLGFQSASSLYINIRLKRTLKMAAVTDHHLKASPGIFQKAGESASFIRSKLPTELQSPRVAIVCGSGLGGIADTVNKDVKVEIDYLDIPNFPKTTGKLSLPLHTTISLHNIKSQPYSK